MKHYVSAHIDRHVHLGEGTTRRLYPEGPFITTVKVGEALVLTAEPRVLRQLAEDLLVAADKAVKRQDEQESEPLFEAAQ